YLIADEAGFAAADEEEGKALLETGMKCAEKWFDLNEGTPAMCAVLAGMSIATVKTDVAFSGRCLSAARRMESAYLAAHPEDATGIFLMSTALYRADGSLFDKGRAESFLAAAPEPDLTDENIFYGCAFYLFTRRRVDTLVCERLMKQMTEESSSIAQNDRRSPYMAGEDRNDDRGIFASAIKISFVNYAITNHEYRTALQNYVHYFLGRNSEKKVQIPENSSMGWYLLLMACTQEETAAISEDG
ncbi:MAG: hypothetical protein K6E33_08170, partial [Lachnospiraceae bacterium]|nr:hypothetical protein [Lachnospiraceae bacterium]